VLAARIPDGIWPSPKMLIASTGQPTLHVNFAGSALLRAIAGGWKVGQSGKSGFVTEIAVNRRSFIRQLYRAEEIDATSVRHLTLATKAQQKTWLALYDDPQSSIPKGHQLKAWLFGGASISTSVALFDLETYQGRN
jgi:hypothetical protein